MRRGPRLYIYNGVKKTFSMAIDVLPEWEKTIEEAIESRKRVRSQTRPDSVADRARSVVANTLGRGRAREELSTGRHNPSELERDDSEARFGPVNAKMIVNEAGQPTLINPRSPKASESEDKKQ